MRTVIQKLLDSEVSAYKISKDTGVSAGTVQHLRAGNAKLDRLGLLNAEKLYKYQLKIEKEK